MTSSTAMTIRPALPEDIPWIVAQESRPDFASFIHKWPAEEHRRNLNDPNMQYLVACGSGEARLGFAILAGLTSPAHSVELVRIAVAAPGTGIGQPFLREIMALAFGKLGANRLWLDVFTDNDRAIHTYQAVGFRKEGVLRESALKSNGALGSLMVLSILAREYHLDTNAR